MKEKARNHNGPETLRLTPEIRSALDTLRHTIPGAFDQITRQANVAQVVAERGSINRISIDRITSGDMSIDAVAIEGATGALGSGSAVLESVTMLLELRFRVDWWIDLWVYDESGTWDLGSIHIPMNIGNVSVPAMSDLRMDIPSARVVGVRGSMTPISALDLGAASLGRVEVSDTKVPSEGFSLSGMGIGKVTLDQMTVPQAFSEEVRVERAKPTSKLAVPGVALTGLEIPSTTVPEVCMPQFGMQGVASDRSLRVDAGVLGITVRVTPVAHIHVGSMRLANLKLAASLGTVRLENVRVPIDIEGITMSGVEMASLSVNGVTL